MQPITAKAWILINAKQGSTIRGKNIQEQREVASLTKMYTLYSCLSLNETLRINPYQTVIKTFATNVPGTTANLLPQRYIRLLDLYYGLMLPSGNDAACLLACYYGFWLTSKPQGPPKPFLKQPISDKIKHYELYSKKFVQYMNQLVKDLNHVNTHFENPHGLGDKNQVSTASEVGEACLKFMKNSLFIAICGSQAYKGCYYESQESFQWQNTNILLAEGYKGIKTGFTTSAGGCLSSFLEIQPLKYQKYELLVVVLGSSDAVSRFTDTKAIVSDFLKYLKMMTL